MSWSYRPLFDLLLRTPRLRLHLPTLDDLAALGDLAAEGVHDPADQPFSAAWTDAPPADRHRGTMQYHWSTWGAWRPEQWSLPLVVEHDGVIVGMQELMAHDFPILREVATGSWLGRRYHGRGIGTEMRAAILELAFVGLGAVYAVTAARETNAASQGVSRKLGYTADGVDRHVIRGEPVILRRLRLDRAAWQAHRSTPVEICELDACLPCFGLPASDCAELGRDR